MQKSRIWDIVGAIGMISGFAVAGYSWATTVSDLPPIVNDWLVGFGIGFVIFCLSSVLFIYKLYGAFVWAEPDVEITHLKKEAYSHAFYWIAQLEIRNKEEIEITNCYATVEEAKDVYGVEIDGDNVKWKSSPLIPHFNNKPDRVIWDENQEMYGRCEMTIPLKDSRHINIMDTLEGIHYNFCGDKKLEPNHFLNGKVFTFKIRVDGKFNDKGMKPLYFEGYVFYTYLPINLTSEDSVTKVNRIGGQVYSNSPYMVFDKGDWTKDKEIIRVLKVERIEAEKWLKENEKRIAEMNEGMDKKKPT